MSELMNKDICINAYTNVMIDVNDLLKWAWHIKIAHICCIVNKCANALAKIGMNNKDMLKV